MSEPTRKKPRRRPRAKSTDPLHADFGPGTPERADSPEASRTPAGRGGPLPGLACAGEGCLLKPAADLVGRFVQRRGGSFPLGLAAISGIELLKGLRDFLDEEIALAERATGRGPGSPRYERIPVE